MINKTNAPVFTGRLVVPANAKKQLSRYGFNPEKTGEVLQGISQVVKKDLPKNDTVILRFSNKFIDTVRGIANFIVNPTWDAGHRSNLFFQYKPGQESAKNGAKKLVSERIIHNHKLKDSFDGMMKK